MQSGTQAEGNSRFRVSGRTLDRVEQLITVPLYLFLTVRVWPTEFSVAGAYPLILLASEGSALLFLLIRRSTDRVTGQLWAWAVAAGGSATALLVRPGGEPLHIETALVLALAGCFMQVAAKLSLRRSFGLVAANRGVKTGGVYRFIRHPMYAGYATTQLGFLLYAPTLWNAGVYLVTWSLFMARIRAEEDILARDPAYREFSERVRYRLLPWIY